MTRYLAPGGVLLAVTAAVLAIHYGVQQQPAKKTTSTTTARVAAKPRHATIAAVNRFYVVQRGDSFSLIAVKTRTSVARLERLNPGVSSTALRVGQRIRVK